MGTAGARRYTDGSGLFITLVLFTFDYLLLVAGMFKRQIFVHNRSIIW